MGNGGPKRADLPSETKVNQKIEKPDRYPMSTIAKKTGKFPGDANASFTLGEPAKQMKMRA